jgi:hypothetical protein
MNNSLLLESQKMMFELYQLTMCGYSSRLCVVTAGASATVAVQLYTESFYIPADFEHKSLL